MDLRAFSPSGQPPVGVWSWVMILTRDGGRSSTPSMPPGSSEA